MNKLQTKATANAIATLMNLACHSLSPTQTRMATRSAGELLWLLGAERYEYGGRVFVAAPPDGDTVDLSPVLELTAIASSGATPTDGGENGA